MLPTAASGAGDEFILTDFRDPASLPVVTGSAYFWWTLFPSVRACFREGLLTLVRLPRAWRIASCGSRCVWQVGRAALQPIIQRRERPGVNTGLTRSMVAALRFFITFFRHMPAREVSLGVDKQCPLIVWSDAAWEKDVGSLGLLVYDPDSGEYLHSTCTIPQYILDMLFSGLITRLLSRA